MSSCDMRFANHERSSSVSGFFKSMALSSAFRVLQIYGIERLASDSLYVPVACKRIAFRSQTTRFESFVFVSCFVFQSSSSGWCLFRSPSTIYLPDTRLSMNFQDSLKFLNPRHGEWMQETRLRCKGISHSGARI
jgi:hypothetical protein